MTSPEGIIFLEDLPQGSGGGKAAGLARLMRAGMQVPRGFVVTDPAKVSDGDLGDALNGLGAGPVAVRSSALDEDGDAASFAGQYATHLDVEGFEAVAAAVRSCAASAESGRVDAYRKSMRGDDAAGIAVVVQNMVRPEFAGVLFTADPVTGDRNSLVVEAVAGCGERLVSGMSVATIYRVSRDSLAVTEESAAGAALPLERIREMAGLAMTAERQFGHPLDMEWAIDAAGALYWLQARPITSLDGPDLSEFDYPAKPGQFFSGANIGEMMPGAVTPLTQDVFGDAIDFCIFYFYKIAGALTRKTRKERFVVGFFGHLFFNLDQMFSITGRVLLSTKETFYMNLLGRVPEEIPEVHESPWIVKFFNCFRFAWYLFLSGPFRKKLERTVKSFTVDCAETDPRKLYGALTRARRVLNYSYAWHLCISTHSGVMNSALVEIMRKGGCPQDELDGYLTELLTDIDGLESAAPLRAMEEVASLIARNGDAAAAFGRMAPAEALRWLASPESGDAGRAYADFVERHGHRCIREAEFREKDWGEDQESLVPTLQRLALHPRPVQAGRAVAAHEAPARVMTAYPGINGRAFRWALKQSRKGVWGREYTKALVIKIQSRIKHAYRRLAGLLAERGLIPDNDLVFFFTHAELERVIADDQALVRRAVKRRRLLPESARLRFPDLFKGKPVPLSESVRPAEEGARLSGTPVSAGVARGPVRMIRSREDAERLRPGEIMVAAFTDIGWTPYYGTAGGIITEVGCSLSHGAVVAREYGLPMVTSLPGVMETLATGDVVEIDGRRGTVDLVRQAARDN